jgi:serine/threonine protein kinase/ActR/RegA family two-component response regulator
MRVCPHCRLIYQNAAFEKCALHDLALVQQDQDPLIGSSLDRYEILEQLGAGAMGRVYRARQSSTGRIVAVKVLYGDYACDEDFRLRFEREAQAVGQMHHDNVVTVTDFGAVEGLPFLVMDFLEGRALEDLIDEQSPFSPARAVSIVRQIASGLDEAHSQGFVHRDMKPSNVVVSGAPPSEVAKILDFGVVSMIYTPLGADRLTTEGQVLGTPMYMSPEQTADPNVTPSSDLYSLGIILYEMLMGRPPFLYEGRMQMMLAHVSEVPPPMPECGGLEMLVMGMLSKDPRHRPSSAKEVIAELDRLALRGFSDKPLDVPGNTEDVAASVIQRVEFDAKPKKKRTTRDSHPQLLAFDTFPALQSNPPAASDWSEGIPPPPPDEAPSQANVVVTPVDESVRDTAVVRERTPMDQRATMQLERPAMSAMEVIPRVTGLPTIEMSQPQFEVVRARVWTPPKPKRVSQELIGVLVLEADRDLSAEIARRLDEHAFRVHHASRLDAGLKMLEFERISAIVMNLTLPDCDGLETLDRVRLKADHIPILVISKLAQEWLAVEAIRRGADDYLTCSAEELRRLQRAVRFAMERKSRGVRTRATPAPRPATPPPPTPEPTSTKRPSSFAMSIGIGAAVFAVGLIAGAVIPETSNAPAPKLAPPVQTAIAEHAESPPPPPPAPTEVEEKKVMLSVNSRPTGAEVWMDGSLAGKTPLILNRPAGTEAIDVELRHPGHVPWVQHVLKNEAGHFVVNAELSPAVP